MSTAIEDLYYDDAELDDFIVEVPVLKSTAPTSDQESDQNDPIETSERFIDLNSKPNLTQTQKLLKAHISVLVSTLGGPDHTADSSTINYKLGHDALACLKDIKRWIKAYDERNSSFDVGLACAESGLVSNDLVVILCQWELQCQKKQPIKNVRTTEKIMLACLELLVLLTWPFEITPQLSENQKLLFSDIRKSQIAYKHSILSYHKGLTFKAVIRLALPSIAKAKQEREPRDNAILRLVIFFLRNVLYIEPANSSISSKSTKQVIDVDTMPVNITYDDISINTVLDVYKRNKALMLLLTVSGSVGTEFDRDIFGPTCLECIFLLTKGTKVEDVFKTAIPRQQPTLSNGNAAQPLQSITTTLGMQLQDLLSDETKRKKAQTQNLQTRHGRFGSLLSIRTNDANSYVISGQEALHNTDSSLDKLDKTKKWNRRKLVKYDSDEFTKITNPVYLNHIGREILYEFVQQFLSGGCFNNLVESVGSIFSGMSDLVSIDEYEKATFFLTCAWFLNYKRERNAWYTADPARMQSLKPEDDPVDFGSVGAALSEITFILIITYFRDSFTTKRWSSLHAAMICFKELLHISQSLFGVTKDSDQHNIDRELAEGIIRKFFSFSDFINIIVQIPQTASKHSPEYLSVTISIVHIILKSFESFANEDVKLYVQTKRKQAKQKKKRVNDLDKHTEDALRAMIENEDSDFEDFEDRMKEIKRERRLDFKATEIRFFQSSIVSTYIEYLSRYEDLTHDEIKRCLSYFHRLFVVLKDFTGLYRLDFMHLLQKLRNYLPRGSSIRKHVDEFIYYFMKKFKVAFARFPMPIEVLFPRFEDPESKTYLAIGELYTKPETTRSSSRLKLASPLEFVRDNFSLDEKFKIMISALYLEEKEGFLFWLKHQLTNIIELRVLDPNHKAVLDLTPTYRRALIQSGTIRLLLSTMGFELPFIVEEDCELPPGVTNEELNEYLQLINKWVSLQPASFEDDKDPSYFMRIKESFDENYGDEDIDYKGFDEDDDSIAFVTEPTNGTRNNLNELDTLDALERELEGVKGKARKKGVVRQEKKSKPKKHSQPKGTRRPPRSFSVTSDDEAPVRSAEYIGDSDDESDDEKAQEFFNREERLRQLLSTSGGIVNPGQLKEFKKAWAKLEKSRGSDTAESVKIALQETSFEKESKEPEKEERNSQEEKDSQEDKEESEEERESDNDRESDEELNDLDALSTTESMEDLKRTNDSDDEDQVMKRRKRRVVLGDDEE